MGQLVLGRFVSETIEIYCPDGAKIVVMLTDIETFNQAHIGIEAPPQYHIQRSELPPWVRPVQVPVKQKQKRTVPEMGAKPIRNDTED